MKIKDILFEDFNPVDLDWVRKNCSEAIERYKDGNIIYRGDRTTIYLNQFMLMTPKDKPREAAHASYNLHNDIINNSQEFSGYPNREIIMTTDDYKADGYGGSKICLPVNGAKIGIVPAEDIFVGFKHIPSTLGAFYTNLKYEFIPDVRDLTSENFMSVQSTNRLFHDISQNASKININELIDEWENRRSNAPLYWFRQQLVECLRQGNGQPMFSLFTADGFMVVPISQFEAQQDREVWTDSPVVLLNEEDAHKLLTSDNT